MNGLQGGHGFQLELLGLLLAMGAIAALARRLAISYPIVLVIAGLAASFIPGIPRLPLPPQMVFLVFLPPLLYAAAWQTSWREFKAAIGPISMLAIGLVSFTVFVVAITASYFIPELDWRAGFLLGAVVSPTDAVAATTIARRLGLPRRVVDILEGESLLNDATGLLALELGLELLNGGAKPSVSLTLIRLFWLLGGGIVVGLAVGIVVSWFEHWVNDGPVEILLTLITPYAVYLAGESIHASGIIAVVACGLFLSRRSAQFFSAETRLQVNSVWEALTFLLNGLTFLLLGLQLPYVLSGLRGYSRTSLAVYAVGFAAVLIAARLAWVFPSSWVRRFFVGLATHHPMEHIEGRELFIVGWTGMRGVVALAAANSLPYTLSNGQPFGARSLIAFLTFSVILITLVGQGLTLPPLIRALRINGQGIDCEEGDARRILLKSAIDHLQHEQRASLEEDNHAFEDLLHQYEHKLDALTDCGEPGTVVNTHDRLVEIALKTISVERETLILLRDSGRISDVTLRTLEHELDLSQSRFRVSQQRPAEG